MFPASLDTIIVHVRERSIIPQQAPALTTAISRKNPFTLTVGLSVGNLAKGELFWDDGESLDTFERGDYSYLLFFAEESYVVSKPIKLNGSLDGLVLGEVRVFGVQTPPTAVWANGQKVPDFSYRLDTKVLTVAGLELPMTAKITIQWS